MKSLVTGFPALLRALQPADDFLLEAQETGASGLRGICLIGMGGSSISGALTRGLLQMASLIPIISVRGYSIPTCVREDWASVVVSYSGNTEETLSAFEQASAAKSIVFAITSGGLLQERSLKNPLQELPTGIQPRAALPLIFSIMQPLVESLTGLKRSDLYSASLDLERMAKGWNSIGNAPSDVASTLHNSVPLFIGAGHLAPVAYRAKCQINENAKTLAFSLEVPELNHNEVEAFGEYSDHKVVPVFLRSQWESARITRRIDKTSDILSEKGVEPIHMNLETESELVEALAQIHFMDMVSVELAQIRGVDSLAVPTISDLKKRLDSSMS